MSMSECHSVSRMISTEFYQLALINLWGILRASAAAAAAAAAAGRLVQQES